MHVAALITEDEVRGEEEKRKKKDEGGALKEEREKVIRGRTRRELEDEEEGRWYSVEPHLQEGIENGADLEWNRTLDGIGGDEEANV